MRQIKLKDIIKCDWSGEWQFDWEVIEAIPEFAALKEAKQNPKWHAEGTAWEHTKCVCNEALKMTEGIFSAEEMSIFLAGCLFHDIGKGVTTFEKDGKWHSYGHEIAGESITRQLLWDEGWETREAVCALVRWHMEPLDILKSKAPMERMAELHKIFGPFRYASLDTLIRVKKCDLAGSKQEDETEHKEDASILEYLGLFAADNIFVLFNGIRKTHEEFMKRRNGKKKVNLIMLVGLPGAGKNTFIENHGMNKEGYCALSRDDIRVELGFCKEGEKIVGTPEQESAVNKVFDQRLSEAAEQGKFIVINNLNTKKKYRTALLNKLKSQYNVTADYYYIEAPTIQDNLDRRAEAGMREGAFESIIKAFDWPTPEEYNSLVCVETGEEEIMTSR